MRLGQTYYSGLSKHLAAGIEYLDGGRSGIIDGNEQDQTDTVVTHRCHGVENLSPGQQTNKRSGWVGDLAEQLPIRRAAALEGCSIGADQR